MEKTYRSSQSSVRPLVQDRLWTLIPTLASLTLPPETAQPASSRGGTAWWGWVTLSHCGSLVTGRPMLDALSCSRLPMCWPCCSHRQTDQAGPLTVPAHELLPLQSLGGRHLLYLQQDPPKAGALPPREEDHLLCPRWSPALLASSGGGGGCRAISFYWPLGLMPATWRSVSGRTARMLCNHSCKKSWEKVVNKLVVS